MANLMLSVMGAFAEFERSLIRQRQRKGSGVPKTLLALDYGICGETIYQYLRHAKLE